MRSSIRSSIRRLVSNRMIDRRSENVTVEEGDRRTWELAGTCAVGIHRAPLEVPRGVWVLGEKQPLQVSAWLRTLPSAPHLRQGSETRGEDWPRD